MLCLSSVRNRESPSWSASLTALATSLIVLLLPASGPGQPAPSRQRDRLAEADSKFAAEKLLEAERLYQAALERGDNPTRRRCLEALAALNAHLGRHGQAVQYGLRYRELLKEARDLPRLHRLSVQLGESYLSLGHYHLAAEYFQEALASEAGEPLPLPAAITARAGLVQIAEARGNRARATALRGQLEEQVVARFDRSLALSAPRNGLTPTEQIRCVQKLASCCFQERPERTIGYLEQLLPLHDKLQDPKGKRDTLRLLAAAQNAHKEHTKAEAALRQALALHAESAPKDRLTEGDLWAQLAETLLHLQRQPDDEICWDKAAECYGAFFRQFRSDQPEALGAISAFWKLQQLYQQRQQHQKALGLLEEHDRRWDGDLWMQTKLKREKGSLQVLLGSYEQARTALRESLALLEEQQPLNLIELPRTLLALAVAEQALGGPDRTETLARKSLELYRRHDLPEDLTLVETWNLLGTCLALRGRYAQAIGYYRDGVACCERLGSVLDRSRSNLLLSLALLHRAQGDLDEAQRCCLKARDLYQHFADPESLEMAGFHCALADLHSARGRYEEADVLARQVLRLCGKHQVVSGPLVIAARHYQAQYLLWRREYAPAQELWRTVLALQEKEQDVLLLPRTLNYLGVTAETLGRPAEAEKYYRRALDLQQKGAQTFPATRFITLWRLANVAERRGQTTEALALLDQAVAGVEEVRLQTYGDAQQRSSFFAQFAPGFEQMVDWSVRAGRNEDALFYAARTRGRSLLDQLRFAGVDPRRSLQGTRGEQLVKQESALGERISAIRARAQLLNLGDLNKEEAKKLAAELEQVQQRYSEVWREILNASPVYRGLSGLEQKDKLLATVREKLLAPGNLLLVYYLGQKNSYLLLASAGNRQPEVFPLTASNKVLRQLTLLRPPEGVAAGTRGLELRPTAGENLPAEGDAIVALTQARVRFLVDLYRRQLGDPASQSQRGLSLVSVGASGPDQSVDLGVLGDLFLPPAARGRIKELAPETVFVVPDGPLHNMPLEALPLTLGPKPRYLLDELPPLIYAPSLTVLAALTDRPTPDSSGPLSLLTVGNPAYPEQTRVAPADLATRSGGSLLGLRGQLPPLPFTAEESRRIRQCFAPDRVRALEGGQATEAAVVAALPGRKVVHLAVHGFADERFGNLFGALALTPPPPGQEKPADDGFLSLHEIYTLPLQDCQLAVLSACVTNVGPQRPLEAGVTLANGFLAAGAQRVVASHWSVDDRSTAELMSVFFGELTAARGEPIRYAQALQKARMKVRSNPRWASPFYWAPFVLIGPPEQVPGR